MRDLNSSEFRDTQTAFFSASWTAADANQDGLLNREEFGVWYDGVRKKRSEEGQFVFSDSQDDDLYALVNALTEGTDGITFQEFMMLMGPYTQVWHDLKASGAGQ